MGVEYQKVKSAPKAVRVRGPELEKMVLQTMRTISSIVGDTLGPGGRPVLIERFEHDLPPMVTKDGVTVFRALGFEGDGHVVMEAARDASVRTAMEAGDGTTTATILAEAVVRYLSEYCSKNPKVSPQRAVQKLRDYFGGTIEPTVTQLSVKADTSTPEGFSLLRSVAKVSGNGDEALADAVMDCFGTVGDEGNVTISEVNGSVSHYEVEKVEGYPVPLGYEQCALKFAPMFVNDQAGQRCVMEQPAFIAYHGRVNDIQVLIPVFQKIGKAWQDYGFNFNVVLIATGFSESVLGHLAVNFSQGTGIKVFPMLAPQSPVPNGQLDFLLDVCAVAGCTLFDPVSQPLENGDLNDLGPYIEEANEETGDVASKRIRGVDLFEATRFRSNIVIQNSDAWAALSDSIAERVEEVEAQLAQAPSELEKAILQERIGKLTGGIARLKVIGSSNGELKERRDRAEDAVCAVRGAVKHGCLPGGGWTLLRLSHTVLVEESDPVLRDVLGPALREPTMRLLANAGLNEEEATEVIKTIIDQWCVKKSKWKVKVGGDSYVYDASTHEFVDPFERGLLDSAPAVLEAVRNSISIASLLGTLGGMVVFKRDHELERTEARATQAWLRDANVNEADQRA